MDKSVEQPMKMPQSYQLNGPPPPLPMNNNYGVPIQMNPNPYPAMNRPPLMNNQVQIINVVVPNFGTQPVSINCQFCRTPITTKVRTSLNFCNCLLCFFTSFTFWVCVQCIRKKEINCLNAEHKCPNCGQILGYYSAC